MRDLESMLVTMVLALVLTGGAYWLGNYKGKTAGLHACELAHAAAKGKGEADLERRVKDSERAETHALDRWNKAQIQSEALAKELKNAQQFATGRRCLSVGAVRVLNAPAGGPLHRGTVPEDSSAAAGAADAFASDADVIWWITRAKEFELNAQGRLDAIRVWQETSPQ